MGTSTDSAPFPGADDQMRRGTASKTTRLLRLGYGRGPRADSATWASHPFLPHAVRGQGCGEGRQAEDVTAVLAPVIVLTSAAPLHYVLDSEADRYQDNRKQVRQHLQSASQGIMHSMVPDEASKLMSQMRRGAIEYCVLALLRRREWYGFELAQALAEADGLVTSEGTIYPLLSRLRRDGLVVSAWRESSQGPPRRYYSLTSEGTAALGAFAEQWARFRNAVDRLLTEEA